MPSDLPKSPTTPAPSSKWKGRVADMFDAVFHVLKTKLPESEAAATSQAIVLSMCDALGGYVVYFPTAKRARADVRNKRIFSDWRGGCSIESLARDHRVSVQTIYSIIGQAASVRGFGRITTAAGALMNRRKGRPQLA